MYIESTIRLRYVLSLTLIKFRTTNSTIYVFTSFSLKFYFLFGKFYYKIFYIKNITKVILVNF